MSGERVAGVAIDGQIGSHTANLRLVVEDSGAVRCSTVMPAQLLPFWRAKRISFRLLSPRADIVPVWPEAEIEETQGSLTVAFIAEISGKLN